MDKFMKILMPVALGMLVGGKAFALLFPGRWYMALIGCIVGGTISYFAFDPKETAKAFGNAWRKTFFQDDSWERIRGMAMKWLKGTTLFLLFLVTEALIILPAVLFCSTKNGYMTGNWLPWVALATIMHCAYAAATGEVYFRGIGEGYTFKQRFYLTSPIALVIHWPIFLYKKYIQNIKNAICGVCRGLVNVIIVTVRAIHNRTRTLVAGWTIFGIVGYHAFGGYWLLWAIGCSIACYVNDATVLVKLRRPIAVNET